MHTYHVSGNQRLTNTTLLLTLVRDQKESSPFSFRPGQYAAISFKRRGRPTAARCFSIVSSPTEPDMLQFSMRTNGRYTKALAGLKNGDEVKVRGPFGGFVFEFDREAETVLLAGGIGITPFMSMIRYAAASELDNKITLLFSCRNQYDVPFADELIMLSRSNPHFRPIFIITDGPTDRFYGQLAASGRITPEIIDKAVLGAYDRKTFFICGPQPFMRSMEKALHGKHVPHERLMTEAFSQGPNHQTGKIRSWPFNVYALSAVGLALGSFGVMVSDLLKTLPPSSIFGSNSTVRLEALTNSRQTDLDALVNAMPEVASTKPSSTQATEATTQTAAAISPAVAATPAPVTATPAPVTNVNPAPTPKPKPKCTTTQSGITTCT